MNAIDVRTFPARSTHSAQARRQTHGVAIVARITTGIVWVILSVAMSVMMLDATFGYSGAGPAVHPPVTVPRVDDGAARRDTMTHASLPEPGPAPGLEAP